MATDTFYAALKILGIGMAGIFIFMLLFWIIIVVLQKIFPGENVHENEEEQQTQ